MGFIKSINKKRLLFLSLLLIMIGVSYLENRSFSVSINRENKQIDSSDIKVSILGDSISTFEGFSMSSYEYYDRKIKKALNGCDGSFYYGSTSSNCDLGNGNERKFTNGSAETWWGRFIASKKFSLGANASFGGSLVTSVDPPWTKLWNAYVDVDKGTSGYYVPSFNTSNRINYLGENGIPDFIFVFGGMNDLINICGSGQTTAANNCVELSSFMTSYDSLLKKLKGTYPNTKLIVLVPFNYGNNTKGGYTEVRDSIIGIANQNSIEYVDLSDVFTNSTYTTCDGFSCSGNGCLVDADLIHPTSVGMCAINKKILSSNINFDVNGVNKPTCSNKTYNGSSQTLVSSGTGYTLTGSTSGTSQGTYTAYATPTVGYRWNNPASGEDGKGTITLNCKINAKSLSDSDITILDISAYTYDGSAKKPTVTVKWGSTTLTNNTDYTVSYSNNTNAGTATVTVTGKGNYTGTKTKSFTINAKSLSDSDITISDISAYTYDGSAKKPTVTVKWGSTTLTNNTDYTVSYSNNTNKGTATVTVTGKGNYTGTKTKSFTINAKKLSDSDITISDISAYTYDGSAKKPTVTVKWGSTTLTNNTDYTVSYSNNTNKGTATVTVTGKGNYTGTKTKSFTINAKKLSDSDITIEKISAVTYNGSAQTPDVTVKWGTKTLTNNTDYTVSYSSNMNKGTAAVTVTGKGNYTGTKSTTFTINAANASSLTVSIPDQEYTASAITPTPTVKIGSKTLTKDTDYTVSYDNNINIGDASITVTSKNSNITGSKTTIFNIVKANLSSSTIGSISAYTYDGTAKKPTVTVKMGSTNLVENTDYTVSYSNNTNAGTATVTVTGKGNYTGTNTKNFTINAVSISGSTIGSISTYTYDGSAKAPTPTVTLNNKTLVKDTDYTLSYSNNTNAGTATVTVIGKGNYTGTNSKTFTINAANLSDSTIENISAVTYDGNAKTPTVTVKIGDKLLTKNTDYMVSYSNNTNAGTATATVTGKGNYTGTNSKTFIINAANASSLTISNIPNQEYTGNEITPTPTVKIGSIKLNNNVDYTLSYSDNVDLGVATVIITGNDGNITGSTTKTFKIVSKSVSLTTVSNVSDHIYTGENIIQNPIVMLNDEVLVKDVDYELTYSNNVNAGVASMTITGIGELAGTKTINYNITKPDISDATISSISDYYYDGNAKTPTPTITLNSKTLVKDTDYTLSYSNNTSKGTATVTVTGKGNYTGTTSKNFKINEVSISGATINNVSDKEYTGSAITPIPTVIVNNKTLIPGTDYSVNYSDNVEIGTATIEIVGMGNYVDSKEYTFEIKKADISKANVEEITSQIYTGEKLNPSPEITLNGKKLKRNTDYILNYTDNIDVGMATIKITGIGNYTNEKTVKFIIRNKSSEKKLKTLNVGSKSILQTLSTTVSYSTDKIVVDAEPLDENATILGTGEKELKEGQNIFEITVIAEDGTEEKYPIIITREPYVKSSNNNLLSLKVDKYNFNSQFDSDTLNYEMTVKNEINSINIEAFSDDVKATVMGAGTKDLIEGENIFKISVIAEDETVKVYTIKVIRENQEINSDSTNTKKIRINEKNPPTGLQKISISIFSIAILSIIIFRKVKSKKYI